MVMSVRPPVFGRPEYLGPGYLSRRVFPVAGIAELAGSARATSASIPPVGTAVFPRSIRMKLTDPPEVIAIRALDRHDKLTVFVRPHFGQYIW